MSEATPAVASTTTATPPPVAPAAVVATPAAAPAATTKILGGEGAPAAAAPAAAVEASKPAETAPDAAVTAKLEADKALDGWQPKFPEGTKGDDALVGAFKPLAKELGLKPEQAQKLIDFDTAQQTAARANAEKIRDGWLSELKADKDFGGEKFDASVQEARKGMALAETKVPGLKSFLDSAGLANNPFLVKAFRVFGAGLAEDSIGSSGAGAPNAATDEKALQSAMYPNTKF